MTCGTARFGREGQKKPKIENFGLKVFSLGPRGDPHMSLEAEVEFVHAVSAGGSVKFLPAV